MILDNKPKACEQMRLILHLPIVFFFPSGMWSILVHRLGGKKERRQRTELLWDRGVLRLQGEFIFSMWTYQVPFSKKKAFVILCTFYKVSLEVKCRENVFIQSSSTQYPPEGTIHSHFPDVALSWYPRFPLEHPISQNTVSHSDNAFSSSINTITHQVFFVFDSAALS